MKEKKKEFQKAEVEVIWFKKNAVIATSTFESTGNVGGSVAVEENMDDE